jgi:flagellum-specific peptidoglycan hydrolase FlgJ
MTPAEFVQTFKPYADAASAKTGVPAASILAQAAIESGWDTSNHASQGNNLFGISEFGFVKAYPSVQACFDDWVSLMNNSRYSSQNGERRDAALARTFGDFIQRAGWCPNTQYGSTMEAIINENAAIFADV